MIECVGYEREDGLWDIEGHLTDVKAHSLTRPESGEEIEPGTPTHDMWMRFTIDMSFRIHRVEVAMDACRFPLCRESVPNHQKLEGLIIGRGFKKAVRHILGDIRGCTHLRELIGRMATTAFQATARARQLREGYNSKGRGLYLINTCSAYASDSPVVLERWPSLYSGPAAEIQSVNEPLKPS
jgi:hypothetical protein